jgi:hypothetical protein
VAAGVEDHRRGDEAQGDEVFASSQETPGAAAPDRLSRVVEALDRGSDPVTTEVTRLAHIEEKLDRLLHLGLDRPLTVKKNRAADLLSVSRTTLDRLVARKELGTVRIGDVDMIPMHELLRLTSLPAKCGRKEVVAVAKVTTAQQDAEAIRALAKARRRG